LVVKLAALQLHALLQAPKTEANANLPCWWIQAEAMVKIQLMQSPSMAVETWHWLHGQFKVPICG